MCPTQPSTQPTAMPYPAGPGKEFSRCAWVAAGGTTAWNRLEARRGLGWVSASKLLARKRPWLIPVSDRVVRCAPGAPRGPWLWLNDRLGEDAGELAMQLLGLRADAGVPESVPAPRVLTSCGGCGTTAPTATVLSAPAQSSPRSSRGRARDAEGLRHQASNAVVDVGEVIDLGLRVVQR